MFPCAVFLTCCDFKQIFSSIDNLFFFSFPPLPPSGLLQPVYKLEDWLGIPICFLFSSIVCRCANFESCNLFLWGQIFKQNLNKIISPFCIPFWSQTYRLNESVCLLLFFPCMEKFFQLFSCVSFFLVMVLEKKLISALTEKLKSFYKLYTKYDKSSQRIFGVSKRIEFDIRDCSR